MRAKELLKEETVGGAWSIRQKDSWESEMDDGDGYAEIIQNAEFDILYNRKVVGSVTYDSYFGNMLGDFGARSVEISRYEGANARIDLEQRVMSAVENYFDSPTGQHHLEVMSRQQGLAKEELEEIKVTKTLAGKRTKPTQDLASKEKMSRKKKYRDGSEKKDASTPMNRNVHDLANITLKGEYRS